MPKLVGASAAAVILAVLSPPSGQLWPAQPGLDAALGGLAGNLAWLVCGYLGLCTLLATGARMPGIVGRISSRAARAITPVALRGLLGLACSLTIAAPGPARADQCVSQCVTVDLDRPAAAPAPSAPARPHGVPTRSVVHSSTVVVRRGDCLWSIAAATLAARHAPAHPSTADIARSWPRWYVANRTVIGADPNLLFAGERLIEPNP